MGPKRGMKWGRMLSMKLLRGPRAELRVNLAGKGGHLGSQRGLAPLKLNWQG
jgi:hypothetical protein